MLDQERHVVWLAVIGLMIGLGKLLASEDPLTLRRIIGRSILGSATSLAAGVVVLQIPDIPPLALYALASGIGVTGAQFLESWLRRMVGGRDPDPPTRSEP